MRKRMWTKYLIIGIIVNLIGAGAIPIIQGKTAGSNYLTIDKIQNDISSGDEVYYPTADTWIGEHTPGQNHGSDQSLLVSDKYGTTADYEADALLNFDLSQIPSGTSILVASLYLYYFNYYDTNPVNREITCHRITSDWKENIVTWNSQPSYNATETANAFVPSQFGWMRWDVTLDVQDFVNGIGTNYGWLIRDYKAPWHQSNIPQQLYKSREATENHPYLEITRGSNLLNKPQWKFAADYEVTSVSISADGNYTAIGTGTQLGTNNGKIYFFRTNDPTHPWNYDVHGYVQSVALSLDGNYLAAGTSSNTINKLFFFSKNSANPIWSYSSSSYIASISISTDGSYIAAGLQNGKVLIFYKTGNTPIFSYDTGNAIESVVISSDGWFTVAGSNDGRILCFNQSTLLWSFNTGSAVHSLSLSTFEYYIVAGNDAGNIICFHLDNSTPRWIYNTNSTIHSVSISADGEYMAAGNDAGRIICFTRDNATPCWSKDTNSAIHSVSISADGEYITAGNDAGIAYLFQRSSDQPLWVSVLRNNFPYTPSAPSGEKNGKIRTTYTYTASTTDPDGDHLYYEFSWGDGTTHTMVGPYASGETASASHQWNKKGNYDIRVRARDLYGATSEWSDPLKVTMPLDTLDSAIISMRSWSKLKLIVFNPIQEGSLRNLISQEKNEQPLKKGVLPQLPPYQMNRDDDISLLENIILNPLLIPRINSIAISAKGEFIVAGSADKNLYFLHSWDDVIEDVVDDNTYVNTIPITYAIIHDPSGDSSYAYLGQSTENEIDFSNSLEVGREIGIEAKIGWCGVGVGYYQNISTTTSYSNDVYIDYRLNEQVSSQQLSNKEKIGPGHGDTYWIEEWNIPYQLVNRTLKLGDVIIFSHPVFKFGVIRQHTVFISADTINKTYQEPWRTQLLNLNIGYDNKIDPKESPFVKYIDYIHFEGGISYLYDETITETHSRSFSFDFGIKEAAATELGLDFIPGVTGQALIKTSLTFGAGITSKTSQVKERACTLYDAVSYGENLDNLSIIFYQDKIFGTLLFITDKNTSYTSGPHEYWTQKADAVPPAVNINQPLEGQQVQGTVWIVVSATDNDPNKFYQIFIDNVEKFNTTTQDDNIQWPWDTTSYPDGSHVIKAQVTDSSGNTGSDTHTVTVNNYYYHYFKPRSFTTSFPMQSNYVASR